MRLRFTIRDVFWLTLVVALAVALYQCRQLNSKLNLEISRVYPGDVTFIVKDADTKKDLAPKILMPDRLDGWPTADQTIGAIGRVEYKWVGIEPIVVGITSNGYERLNITVDRNSRSYEVPLHKLDNRDGSGPEGKAIGD